MIFVSCLQCPLRALPLFLEHSPAELGLIESLKREQIVVGAGTDIVREGQVDGPLFTLLRGWAFRYRMLADGRRQILNFLLAGDFIGVQQRMADSASYGVQALSEVLLCVFPRDALEQVHRQAPALGFGITWLAAHELSIADDGLLAGSRRSAEERITRLFLILYKRVAALMPPGAEPGVPFPLTQQQVADALGLSLTHTKASLRRMEKRGVHRITDGRLYLLDLSSMSSAADVLGLTAPEPRPLI